MNGDQPPGSVTSAFGAGLYTEGTLVPVGVNVAPGYVFSSWSDDWGFLQDGGANKQFTNPNHMLIPHRNAVITAICTSTVTPTPSPATFPCERWEVICGSGAGVTIEYIDCNGYNQIEGPMGVGCSGGSVITEVCLRQIVSVNGGGANHIGDC